MKRSMKQIVTIFILTALLGGCAGMTALLTKHGRLTAKAEDAYTQGDLDETIRKTVKALTLEPEYEKAQRLLVSAFQPAISGHEEKASSLKGSQVLAEMSQVIQEYETLVELSLLVRRLPPIFDKSQSQTIRFATTDFSPDLLKSKEVAAEAYYQEANRMGAEGGMAKSRIASEHFAKAMTYIQGYKDASVLSKKYQKAGTKRVAILPFLWPEDQGQYNALGKKIINDFKHAIRSQHQHEMKYLEFVSSEAMAKKLSGQNGSQLDIEDAIRIGRELAVHEVIIGDIRELFISPPSTNEEQKQETTTVTITREKNLQERGVGALGNLLKGVTLKNSVAISARDSRMVKEDITVSADIKIFELNTQAKVSGAYQVINLQTADTSESPLIKGEFAFVHRWASFSGDKRALSKGTKKLLKHNANKKAPSENQIVKNAVDDFSKSLLSTLKVELFSIEGYR